MEAAVLVFAVITLLSIAALVIAIVNSISLQNTNNKVNALSGGGTPDALPRSGALPMLGDLSLGGHALTHASLISNGSSPLSLQGTSILANDHPLTLGLFSIYTDGNVIPELETDLLAGASATGSLTYPMSQPLGMTFFVSIQFVASTTGGGPFTIRLKNNGVTFVTEAIPIGSGLTNLVVAMDVRWVVQDGSARVLVALNYGGNISAETSLPLWDRTQPIQLSITGGWQTSGNQANVQACTWMAAFP